MEIPKINSTQINAANQHSNIKKPETKPQDSFRSSEISQKESPPQAMMNISSVLTIKSLDKINNDYRFSSSTTAPDGTVIISYSASKKDKETNLNKGYISAVSPSGEISWETSFDSEGMSSINTGYDGTIYAVSRKNLKAVNPDGTLKFEHQFPVEVNSHFTDSSGNLYFKTSTGGFYEIDRNGNRVDIPECMTDLNSYNVKQTSPDELVIRNRNEFYGVDLAKGKSKLIAKYNDPVEKKSDFSRNIDSFEIDESGNIRLWISNTTRIPYNHGVGFDEHFGLGFGRRWGGMPHPPRDDEYYKETIITSMSVEMLNKDGSIIWKAENLGSDPVKDMLPDGTIIYSNNKEEYIPNSKYDPNMLDPMAYTPKSIATGKTFISRITPGGMKNEEFMKVEGRVKSIMTNPENGNYLICHGKNNVSEFNPKGDLLRTKAFQANDAELYPEELSGNNAVIFRNIDRTNAFRFDMETGILTNLTEREKDYSYKTVAKEMEDDEDFIKETAESSIEEYADMINIGGVWVPRRNS